VSRLPIMDIILGVAVVSAIGLRSLSGCAEQSQHRKEEESMSAVYRFWARLLGLVLMFLGAPVGGGGLLATAAAQERVLTPASPRCEGCTIVLSPWRGQ
jgi:hypothetical protein